MSTPSTDVRRAPEPDSPERPSAPPRRPKPAGGSFTGRALVLALVAATLLVTLAVPVRSWFAQRAEIAGLRSDVAEAQDRVAALEVQKERWEDPAFVAAEARRRLHFVLPGEVGYVTLGSEESLTADGEPAGPDQPWYSALWGAVREVDTTDAAADTGEAGDRPRGGRNAGDGE